MNISLFIKALTARESGPVYLKVLRLRTKNRTSYFGSDFRGNVESECIGKSALTETAEYRESFLPVKEIGAVTCYTYSEGFRKPGPSAQRG